MAILQETHQNLTKNTWQSCKKYIKTLQKICGNLARNTSKPCKKYIAILQEIHRNLARDIKTLQELCCNLARNVSKSCKMAILSKSCETDYLVILQELSITCKKMTISIARLASPAIYLFNTCKILQDLQENFIARLAHILQDGFYWIGL